MISQHYDGKIDRVLDQWRHSPIGVRERNTLSALRQTAIAHLEELQGGEIACIAQLDAELDYQLRSIRGEISEAREATVEEIQRSTGRIVESIQDFCGILDDRLLDIRWAIDRQTEITEKIYKAMITRLSHEARELLEQGVTAFELGQYADSEGRLLRASELDVTNHLIYQYLGLIALGNGKASEAIGWFERAEIYSIRCEDRRYHSEALAYKARALYKLGRLNEAIESVQTAIEYSPTNTMYWMNLATYGSELKSVAIVSNALRNAISIDLDLFSYVADDRKFDTMKATVAALLIEIRDQERQEASAAMKELKEIHFCISEADREAGPPSVAEISGFREHEQQLDSGNIFQYRDLKNWALKKKKISSRECDKSSAKKDSYNRK